MVDFQFLQNPISKKWVVLAPRRAKRPNVAKAMLGKPDVARGSEPVCPFCPGPFGSAQGKQENLEEEVYRVPASVIAIRQLAEKQSQINGIATSPTAPRNDDDGGWQIRVLKNKFPFAPIHQVIIHSPDHHKNFDELSLEQVQLILETYRHQYNEYAHKGQVYIFHNRGEAGGESLPHPHSQLAVVPFDIRLETPRLDLIQPEISAKSFRWKQEARVKNQEKENHNSYFMLHNSDTGKSRDVKEKEGILAVETSNFTIFCPEASQWPDEVWIAPKKRGRAFGEITDAEIVNLSHILQRLIQIFDLRHGNNFPFNFYIYPGGDWYLRLIPRLKVLGGFEIGTGIFVNTQKPEETMAFIQGHFESCHSHANGNPNHEKTRLQMPSHCTDCDGGQVKKHHKAEYEKRV